ncbi:MAG: hypothetical protein ACO1OB_29215 [Archangium sp.]
MNKTLLVLALLVAAPSSAQEAPPGPPLVGNDVPLADPGGRFRWGASAGAGWHFPYSAFGLGVEGRVGYQVSNVFSTYLALGGTFGIGFGASSDGSASLTLINHYVMAVIAEAIFGDHFYVAGGPGLAAGGLAVAGISVQRDGGGTITALGASGVKPTIDLRLGVGFAKAKPSPWFRRGGFNIGLQALVMFHTDAVVVREQADMNGGSVQVQTRELVTTVTPMLMLGYDAR